MNNINNIINMNNLNNNETFEEIYQRLYQATDYEVIRYNLRRYTQYEDTRHIMIMVLRNFINVLYEPEAFNFYNYLLDIVNNININNNNNNINYNNINNINNNNVRDYIINNLIERSRINRELFRVLDMICSQCRRVI